MATWKAIKLLAVVALTSACDKGAPPKAAPKATQAQTQDQKPAVMQTAQPRTLRNGRPACGNVGGKAPIPPECKQP